MKFIILILLFLLLGNIYAQDPKDLIKDGIRLESTLRDGEALVKYKEVLLIQPTNIFAICRCSELCSRLANRIKNNKKWRDDYYAAARTYALSALSLSPRSSDANFVMSVVMGRVALTKSGREKIAAAKDIKKYADLAIQYDPTNYKAWHVLGKWYYEVCNLNAFEKIGIKIFYGGMPSATWQDAINAYQMSKDLSPGFMLNYLELARTYHKNNEDKKAVQLLKVIPNLAIKTEDDYKIKDMAKKMLEELE